MGFFLGLCLQSVLGQSMDFQRLLLRRLWLASEWSWFITILFSPSGVLCNVLLIYIELGLSFMAFSPECPNFVVQTANGDSVSASIRLLQINQDSFGVSSALCWAWHSSIIVLTDVPLHINWQCFCPIIKSMQFVSKCFSCAVNCEKVLQLGIYIKVLKWFWNHDMSKAISNIIKWLIPINWLPSTQYIICMHSTLPHVKTCNENIYHHLTHYQSTWISHRMMSNKI